MKQYAIISDIHGNSRALAAVLHDIRSRGISTIINLGDFFFGALEPEATAELLRKHPMICITGNTDIDILNNAGKDGMARVLSDLSEQSKQWLRSLPKTTSVGGVFFVCHGTPENDNEYLLEKVTENGVFVYNDEELVAKTANISERVILCGHSHVNRVIWLSNGKMIINPGSVGLPAYLGNGKYRFAMESMTPHAKYAIISVDGDDITVNQVNCPYDWDAASEAARKNGNENAANFLLHGRVPKDLRVN